VYAIPSDVQPTYFHRALTQKLPQTPPGNSCRSPARLQSDARFFSITIILFTAQPESMTELIDMLVATFRIPEGNFSYHGNAIPAILTTYLVLGILLDVVSAILSGFFGVKIFRGFWNTFVPLLGLCVIDYALLAVAVLPDDRTAIITIIVFFSLTVAATFVAVGGAHVLDRIQIRTVPPKLSSQTSVIGKNT
jgi:hypothetical protein